MSETIEFLFETIAPGVWVLIINNIFLSISLMIGIIGAVISITQAVKK